MADAGAMLMTIYSLTGDGDWHRRGPATTAADTKAAERIFGPDVRLQSAPTDLRDWTPQAFGDYEWPLAADYTTGKPMPYTVTGVRTFFVNCLLAGDVLVLELRLRGDLDNYIDAQRDAFDRIVQKQLAGKDLLEAAAAHVGAADAERLRGLELGHDKHQIMVLPRAEAHLIFSSASDEEPSRPADGGIAVDDAEEPLDLRQVNFAALGKLMFKDVMINYRPSRVPISLPDDINGPDLQMVAVWASNTVICGIESYNDLGPDYGDLGARRIREMTFVAAQIVAATNRCREIRVATLSVLRQLDLPASPDQDPDQERAELIRYEQELHRLEFDLTFGADVYCGPALVRGGRPLKRYQEAVRTEGGFDVSVALTHRMVEQLTSIITTRRQLFEVTVSTELSKRQAAQVAALRELLDRTEGVKTASVVVASIAVVVSCVGLFAALATVPVSTSSFLGPQFRSAAVAALSVIFAGALGFGVYRASKRPLSERAKNPVRIAVAVLAVLCLTGLILAFVLWSHSGTAVHLYALAGGIAAGVAAVILGIRLADFGPHG